MSGADHQGGPVRGSAFYDRSLLDEYLAHRHRPVTSPNLVMEQPAFLGELGDLRGLRVLDLGCGDGRFAETCVGGGAASYIGVDGSEAMIAEAVSHHRKLPGSRARFELADLEDYQPPPGSADIITSRMALHYVADLGPVLQTAHRALVTDGRLVISVVHPLLSSTDNAIRAPRTDQMVDDYFVPGPRTREWFGRPVTWHHRTVEQYVSLLAGSGFAIAGLREGEPVESLFDGDQSEYERRRRVPVFLVLNATRIG